MTVPQFTTLAKPCPKCGITKPWYDFAPDERRPKQLNRASECRECKRIRVNAAAAERRAQGMGRTSEQKAYNNEWQKRKWANATLEAKAHRIAVNRARRLSNRDTVLRAYGGRCACCGEPEQAFLTVDHVNNDGKAHRRELGATGGSGTPRLYTWAIKHNFPPSLQLLCWNCNLAKAIYGACPHQRRKP